MIALPAYINYVRLNLAVNCIVQQAAQIFKEKYGIAFGAWKDYSLNTFKSMHSLGLSSHDIRTVQIGLSNYFTLTILQKLLVAKDLQSESISIILNDVLALKKAIKSLIIDDTTYNKQMENITSYLLKIGGQTQDIEITFKRIQEKPNGLSSAFTINQNKANELTKLGNFSEAIDIYTKMLHEPTTSLVERSTIYQFIAQSYFLTYKLIQDEHILYYSLVNAKKAVSTWPISEAAHLLLGKIYDSFGNFKRANKHALLCLSLNSKNAEAQSFKAYLNQLNDHINISQGPYPDSFSITYDQKIKKEIMSIGINSPGVEKMPAEEILSILKTASPLLRHLIKGHIYRYGASKFPKNTNKSFKHYSIAAQLTDPEAQLCLSELYFIGEGVSTDIPKAIQLITQAAESINKNMLGRVAGGIPEAQHTLGNIYLNGIKVPQNIENGLSYYERSIKNGSSEAANSLGLYYLYGKVVPKDLTKAELLFKYAANKNYTPALCNLIDCYIALKDFGNAKLWHDRAIQKNISNAVDRNIEINCRIADIERQYNSLNIDEWKQSEDPSVDKLNNKEKIDRLLKESKESKRNNLAHNDLIQSIIKLDINNPIFTNIDIINEHAMKGNYMAAIIIQSFSMCNEAFRKLAIEGEDNHNKSIDCFAKALEIEQSVCSIPADMLDEFFKICQNVVSNMNEKTCSLDRNARVCLMHMAGKMASNKAIEHIKNSLIKYPKDKLYRQYMASAYGSTSNFDLEIKELSALVSEYPNDFDLIYLLAAAQKGQNINNDAIANFKKFIKIAPKEHRNIPNAYYSISKLCYDVNVEDAKWNYKEGLKSEAYQLPIYLPYQSLDKSILNVRFKDEGKPHLLQANKACLADPMRMDCFNVHRAYMASVERNLCLNNELKLTHKLDSSPKIYKRPKQIKINLRDIDFTEDHIENNAQLCLTNIGLPCAGGASLQLTMEDENQDVINVSIYNLKQSIAKLKVSFRIGCIIIISDPYLRLAKDGSTIIRVDDPSTAQILQYKEKLCRACSQSNSPYSCIKCGASYCSKECQITDWKKYNHKIICNKP